MGVIKRILLVFVCVLLFVSLLIGNVFLTFSLSLDKTNIQTELSPVLKENFINGINLNSFIDSSYPVMQLHCQTNSEFILENIYGEYTLNIPCTIINQGSDEIFDYVLIDFIENFYDAEFDCGFLDCLEKTGSPLFLISAKSKSYFTNNFYLVISFSIMLFVFMFFLVNKKSNLFILSGILLIISSLPFMKFNSLFSLISTNIYLDFISIFFTKSYVVFLIMFLFGLVFLGIGILFKIFGVGFFISKFFSKKSKVPKPFLNKKKN